MSFDRLAPHYDRMELLLAAGKLQRMRTRWLDRVPSPRRALLAGEGHGRFLVELLHRAPSAEIVCADASEAMLAVSREKLRRAGHRNARVRFVHADLRSPGYLDGDFDLVTTHFFLDCFPPEQLATVIAGLASVATADACWLVSDFHLPGSGPARIRARLILWLMYRFFRLATRLPARRLATPDALLESHGFRRDARHLAEWGLLRADLWRRG
jgi:ubiquinone/menaquinone biosynthesis C-methylase UbiE